MNLQNYYWCFKSALPHKICDDIINYGISKKESLARTGGFTKEKLNKEEIKNIKVKRDSDIVL